MSKFLKTAIMVCIIIAVSLSEVSPFLSQARCTATSEKYVYLYHGDKYISYFNEDLSVFEVESSDPDYASYDGCLYNKDYTKLISCPPDKDTMKFHPNLKIIGEYAFEDCNKMREIVIPWGVTDVETNGLRSAFDSNKPIIKIILPDTLERIHPSNNLVGRNRSGIFLYSQKNTAAKNTLEGTIGDLHTLHCFEVDSVDYYYSKSDQAPHILKGNWYNTFGLSCYDINGEMLTGWQTVDGNQYYFDGSGYTWVGLTEIDGNMYYFGADSVMQTGWQKLDEKWHYFGENGVMQTGWLETDGKRYYLNQDGIMQTSWQEIEGICYYFEEDGSLISSGWQELKRGKYYYWLYFDETGAMASDCWQKVDGKWLRFDENGAVKKGFWISIAAWFKGLWG